MGSSKWEIVDVQRRRFSFKEPFQRKGIQHFRKGTEYLLRHDGTQVELTFNADGSVIIQIRGGFYIANVSSTPVGYLCPSGGAWNIPHTRVYLEPVKSGEAAKKVDDDD